MVKRGLRRTIRNNCVTPWSGEINLPSTYSFPSLHLIPYHFHQNLTPSFKNAMAGANSRAFQCVLQDPFQLEDELWSYSVPNLPNSATTNSQQLIKSITFVANNTNQQAVLKLQPISPNRAIIADPLDCFTLVSFADFRPRIPQLPTTDGNSTDGNARSEMRPATVRESADYIVKLLRAGIILNGVHYNFYGHSNSQLKSRSCFLYAAPKPDVSQKVESLGDFTKMKTVAKKSKRIGLLFSVARVATILKPDRREDIPDIQTDDYIFTDGCGLISPRLAQELARKVGIAFRNVRYTPSVFQIRYLGYKGVVILDPAMKGEVLIKFRKSMKKFNGGSDFSFAVIEYSKVFLIVFLISTIV
jgi:hypothetical protein